MLTRTEPRAPACEPTGGIGIVMQPGSAIAARASMIDFILLCRFCARVLGQRKLRSGSL